MHTRNLSLLYEFSSISFESLLAFHTTEIICFSVMTDLKFGCLFVQNHAADRIPRHCFLLHSTQSRTDIDVLSAYYD